MRNIGPKKRRARRNTDSDVLAAIHERMLIKGIAGAAIHRELEADDQFRGRVPSLRTVQTIVRDYSTQDDSGSWGLADAQGDEASLVLPVLRSLLHEEDGRRHLSKDEAKWIVRVRRAAPELKPIGAYLLARAYLLQEQQEEDTEELDRLLALRPWRPSDEGSRVAERLVETGDLSQFAWMLGERLLFDSVSERFPTVADPPMDRESP